VVQPKVTKANPRSVAPRHRGHSLAPEHLGEARAAATLIAAIGGVATFIAGVAMMVNGLTIPGRYAGATPPPNVGQLGMPQVLGGVGLLVLGVVVVAAAAALFADLPRSRPLAATASAVAAGLAVVGLALLFGAPRRDFFLIAGLGVALLAFGGAAIVLVRPRP